MAARVTREMAAVFAETLSPKRKAPGLRPLLPRKTKRHHRERDPKFESHFLHQRACGADRPPIAERNAQGRQVNAPLRVLVPFTNPGRAPERS